MKKFSIEVDGVTYTGSTASAKDQFEALHIVGRTGYVMSLNQGVHDMTMVAQLLCIPHADTLRLIELVMEGSVLRESDKVPIAPNIFTDNIENYYLLLAKVLKENLGNFWKLRGPKGNDVEGLPKQPGTKRKTKTK